MYSSPTFAPTQHGFTLVELSIVLVILGLLIGGVLTGQTLIRAAELRSVTAQYQSYITATQTFRDKYFALPGDMSNATRYWGRMNTNGACITNSSAAVIATGACDGDGDGIVVWSGAGGVGMIGEMHQYWRHLAAAGLIEGNYSGASGTGGNGADVMPGINSPKSKLANAGWGAGGTLPGNPDYFQIPQGYGNYLVFGAYRVNNTPLNGAIKPDEAFNIDTKIDDGIPYAGKTIAYPGNGCTTSGGYSGLNGTYKLTDSGTVCSFYFVNQF